GGKADFKFVLLNQTVCPVNQRYLQSSNVVPLLSSRRFGSNLQLDAGRLQGPPCCKSLGEFGQYLGLVSKLERVQVEQVSNSLPTDRLVLERDDWQSALLDALNVSRNSYLLLNPN